MKRGFVIFMVLFSVFLAIGCTGNSGQPAPSETPATTSAGTAVTPGSNTTPQPVGEGKIVEVSIQGFAFNPQSVEISKGDSIKWTNMDSATHDVKGPNFNSGTLANGGTYVFQFTEAGTYDYICSIHPSMKGTIVVK